MRSTITPATVSVGRKPGVYSAGSLTYTRLGLGVLFFWLLWGFFIYILMESLIPSLLPLLLAGEKATNTQISFITTSLNLIGNMFLNPIVSFASDRHRGRWGRRRPFIVWSTPAVVVCLAAIPFGREIAAFLQSVPIVQSLLDLSPLMPAVLVIAVLVMGFQIFDTFVGAVYYYLVRDTVPEEFIARFSAGFRLVSAPTHLFYNLCVFGYAENHMKAIFVVVAVAYGVGICLMCWRVREGQFPPPEPLPGRDATVWGRVVGAVQLYLRDCFRHRVYWASFMALGSGGWANAAAVFAVLFHKQELGISLPMLGKIAAVGNVVAFCIVLPLGFLVDKWNLFRIAQISFLARAVFALWCWFFVTNPATLLVGSILFLLPTTAVTLCNGKLGVLVWPKVKYGQFGSANSALNSIITVFVALLAGLFVDCMGNYRSYLIWMVVLSLPPVGFYLWLEYEWRRLGGKEGYRAP